ncbi:transcription factor MYB119-like isoform X2 [Euphorbia lathyris]|uniref:transcription factor MYB119-like isoform X2 n=1 Tax=Euphorbia lathyris TaxID=212925 RepID=UPI00331392BF
MPEEVSSSVTDCRKKSVNRDWKGCKKNYIIKGQWTIEEDRLLSQLVQQYGVRKWSHIAQMFPGRIGKQCRERWHNHLRPDIKDIWSEEEDKVLIQAHREVGNKWEEIAKRLPGRTENSIKNHWNATKRKQYSKRNHRPKYPRGSLLQDYIKSLNLDSAGPSAAEPSDLSMSQSQSQSQAMEFNQNKGKRKEMFQSSSGEVRGEEINLNHVTPKNEFTDNEESIEGELNGNDDIFDEATDIVSFHSENKVYTLSKAPHLTADVVQVDTPSILCVKNGLKAFLLSASPNDVGLMITQANNIFAFLQGLNADYLSFYNYVRAYIRHCLEWYAADQEVNKCKPSEKSVSHYDQLVQQSIEAKRVVSNIEEDLVKAKMYMAPLEARVQDMKVLLEKFESELGEMKTDFMNLVSKKRQKIEVIEALDAELKATAKIDEQARSKIRENIARRKKARICMEKARNQLQTI